jgi:hypothetical protein
VAAFGPGFGESDHAGYQRPPVAAMVSPGMLASLSLEQDQARGSGLAFYGAPSKRTAGRSMMAVGLCSLGGLAVLLLVGSFVNQEVEQPTSAPPPVATYSPSDDDAEAPPVRCAKRCLAEFQRCWNSEPDRPPNPVCHPRFETCKSVCFSGFK